MLIAHSMNMKTPSVVAMVLLLNISRDNNGCGALERGHSQARSPHITKEKKRGLAPPISMCTVKSHAYIYKYMEMERCEMNGRAFRFQQHARMVGTLL